MASKPPHPQIFQRVMDEMLKGIGGVTCYIDDIMMCSKIEAEHYDVLRQVLCRLQEHMNKCCFLQSSIDYLGHRIDAEGVHPTKSKVEALLDAPAPTYVAELQAFLGFVQYYGRFYRNLSTILSPMNALLRKNVARKWTNECQAAYEACKHGISEGSCLTHYDVGKQIRLACDAFSYGASALLFHMSWTMAVNDR